MSCQHDDLKHITSKFVSTVEKIFDILYSGKRLDGYDASMVIERRQ